jgi:hypothetical protein
MSSKINVSSHAVLLATAVTLAITVLLLFLLQGNNAILLLLVIVANAFGAIVFLARPRLIEKMLGLSLFVGTLLLIARMLMLRPPQ